MKKWVILIGGENFTKTRKAFLYKIFYLNIRSLQDSPQEEA